MSQKQMAIGVIEGLPEQATLSDIIDALSFREKVEKGLKNANEGRVIPHEEVKRRLSKWLTE